MTKLSKEELLKYLKNLHNDLHKPPHEKCHKNQYCRKAYQQIKELIQKPEDYEKNLADCTEAIDILIKQHEELCDELVKLYQQQKPQVTEEFVEKWADRFDSYAQNGQIVDIDLIKQMLKEAGMSVA